ncbi:hypothetical protein BJY00DRAFT_227079 [Aspergillus carlsbadensis]|nr:hypothetical protein BJY00DRAFT_227079 [Aspergillus carlsbadensis]
MSAPAPHPHVIGEPGDEGGQPRFCFHTGLPLGPLPTPSAQTLAERVEDDKRGLFRVTNRTSAPFRLLDLPAEIRHMIYRFAIGYRTLHVRRPNEREIYRRPHSEWEEGKLDWAYFVCRCGPPAHATRSEYAVGQIWAGDIDDNATVDVMTGPGRRPGKKEAWRRALPACGFKEDTTCAAIEKGDTSLVQEKLHLALLRVSKQVHAEARDAFFSTAVFAFTQWIAVAEFTVPHGQFTKRHMARIRNLTLAIQPLTIDMRGLNGCLRDMNDGIGIDNLAGLRRLQVVVQCDTKNVDEERYD